MASSTVPSGVSVHEDPNVVCANALTSTVQLPIYEQGNWNLSKAISKTLYICVAPGEAHIHLALLASAVGFPPDTSAYLAKCEGDSPIGCDIAQQSEYKVLWQGSGGISQYLDRHDQRLFEGNVFLSDGKYKIYVKAGATAPSWARPTQYELFIDLGTPRPGADRTLAQESTCLANNPDPFVAHPVNARTGNFTHQEVDISLPALGLPLTFERSYNSRDLENGPLGRGWTHSYNVRLVTGTLGLSNTVTLVAPRGSRLRFTRNDEGAFTPDPGIRADLVHYSGGYTLTQGNQIVYTFDTQGRLASLLDRNGHATALHYNAAGKLSTITAPGRALTLTYNAQNLIERIADHTNRRVSFGYEARTNGDYLLRTVTDLGGYVTTYSYDDDGYLAAIADAFSRTVTRNDYDLRGRVITQTVAADAPSVFAYDFYRTVITQPNTLSTTYTNSPETGLLTAVTDALGSSTHHVLDRNYNPATITDQRAAADGDNRDCRGGGGATGGRQQPGHRSVPRSVRFVRPGKSPGCPHPAHHYLRIRQAQPLGRS